MAGTIMVPQVGQDIDEAIIVRWLKEVGDMVHIGDIVLEVESDKAVFGVEAYEEGILLEKLAEENDTVQVLTPVGILG